jgi:nucleoside-diphosphate-sugar epimerase
MKVLLLGVTGNVGSRMLPALLAHKHQVVAYVRTPSKISSEATSKLDSIVVGSASDSDVIKAAILSHDCDAVVNAAGLACMTGLTSQGEFPAIFAAVVQAALDAGRERGGAPIRCWLMSGFCVLDSPEKPYLLLD